MRGKTYFLYDGSVPVCELNATGGVTATDTFGADGLVSRHTRAGSAFYTFDPSGNVAQRLDGGGAVLSSDLYDAFGAVTSTASAPDVFGFSGQWGGYTDAETGLVLMTHRYYDPATGRFLTRDPMGYGGGLNLYAYTGNDPINDADPDGLSRRRGKSPPSSWPPPPPNLLGKGGKWNPDGYWEGGKGGCDIVWDPTHHGGGHWDEDERPGNKKGGGRRWNPDGTPIEYGQLPAIPPIWNPLPLPTPIFAGGFPPLVLNNGPSMPVLDGPTGTPSLCDRFNDFLCDVNYNLQHSPWGGSAGGGWAGGFGGAGLGGLGGVLEP